MKPIHMAGSLLLGALLTLAACSDNDISGLPTVDPNLRRVAGFDPLKAALVAARGPG